MTIPAGARPWRWIGLGIVLVLAGVLALWWSAALAVSLLTTCDNKFGLRNAPALRCLQPMGWGVVGRILCFAGVISAAAGLVLRRKRAPR